MTLSNLYTSICIEIGYPISIAIYCPIGWIYGIEIRNGCSVELCDLDIACPSTSDVDMRRIHGDGHIVGQDPLVQ